MDFALLINKFASLPVYITGGYYLFRYRQLPGTLKLFSVFVFVSAIIQFVSTMLWLQNIPNLLLLHIYVAGGFVCLGLFYEAVLEGFIDKKIIRSIMIAFLAFTIINSLFIQPFTTFNSYALITECILVVILALTTYLVMMDDVVKRKRQELASSLNWINSGLFIYYSSSLIIFYYANTLVKFFSKQFNLQTWMLHAFFSLIMYSCFFVGLWKRPRR